MRVRDLETVLKRRYGDRLPPDDAGKEDAVLVLHHLAQHAVDPRGRMRQWLSTWAPWLEPADATAMLERVMIRPRRFRADTLAARLNLTARERTALGVTTIGATDMRKDARSARRRERARRRKEAIRRESGKKPRTEYLATHSISRTKPWIAAGVSRATWYRQQRNRCRETTPATAYPLNMLRP